MSDHVADARDYIARRTDALADRRTALARRAAGLRARRPIAADDIIAAERAASDGLAHAITAHRRAAAQHEAAALGASSVLAAGAVWRRRMILSWLSEIRRCEVTIARVAGMAA